MRDVYLALDDAIAQSSADRACGLAAELACTDGQARPLVSHLVDVFAQRYVSLDGQASDRIARAIGRVCAGDARVPGPARESLCEVVLTMCIGLQDHDAMDDIIKKSGAACANPMNRDRSGGGGGALKLALAIRSREPADAVAIALAMVTAERDNAVGFRVAWDVVSECCDNDTAASAYIAHNACIFGTLTPPRTSRTRRTPLLLYSVLVASRAGSFAQLTPSLACLRGDAVDRAVSLVRKSIDGVFNDILGVMDGDGSCSSSSSSSSGWMQQTHTTKCVTDDGPLVRDRDTDWDYLWMYTTLPGAGAGPGLMHAYSPANVAVPGASKVVTVSATATGGHIRRSRASNRQSNEDDPGPVQSVGCVRGRNRRIS